MKKNHILTFKKYSKSHIVSDYTFESLKKLVDPIKISYNHSGEQRDFYL